MIKERPARIEIDEQVDVRSFALLASGDGTHHANIGRAVAGGDPLHLVLVPCENAGQRSRPRSRFEDGHRPDGMTIGPVLRSAGEGRDHFGDVNKMVDGAEPHEAASRHKQITPPKAVRRVERGVDDES